MTYKLYYDQLSAAEGIRVLLEEIGLPYKLIQSFKDRTKPRPVEQLKINPNGRKTPQTVPPQNIEKRTQGPHEAHQTKSQQ